MKPSVEERLTQEFGPPARQTVKVKSWNTSASGTAVLQVDGPKEDVAYVWLPYPNDGSSVPEIALEYPAEAGRHSGTYAGRGLERGEPALKFKVRTASELDDIISYMRSQLLSGTSLKDGDRSDVQRPVAEGNIESLRPAISGFIDPSLMPVPGPVKPRREAIPRQVQREVWQRDGGKCVECATREKLCFDHIVPFSKGGSNSVRNLQLLCEGCNLAKGNRI